MVGDRTSVGDGFEVAELRCLHLRLASSRGVRYFAPVTRPNPSVTALRGLIVPSPPHPPPPVFLSLFFTSSLSISAAIPPTTKLRSGF